MVSPQSSTTGPVALPPTSASCSTPPTGQSYRVRYASVKKLGTTLLLFQWRMEAQWLFGRLKRSQFTQETSHFSSKRCLEEMQVALCNITQPQVGPYPGSAFGGMKDIKLRGCLASQVRQPVLAVHILLSRQFWTLKRIQPLQKKRLFSKLKAWEKNPHSQLTCQSLTKHLTCQREQP